MGMSSIISGVKKLPRKLFGSRNDRLLKVYARQIAPANELETELRGDFDERFAARVEAEGVADAPEEEREASLRRIRGALSDDLRERGDALRGRVKTHIEPLEQWWSTLDPTQQTEEYYKDEYRKRHAKLISELDAGGIITEAFAVLREASRRAREHRHFDCQLIGGRVLYEGKIAEMRTGEGKTIVCHLAAFMHNLCGNKVHVITVNDYLVKRDAEFAAPIFELVGVSVGYNQSQVDPSGREGIRKPAYGCDVTYGTNSEFGFDYLRDNMKTRRVEQVQGRLDFVVVDEVDSILIDEARTPLIISGPVSDDVTRYPRAAKVAEELVRRQVVWDRKVTATVNKFDGDADGIPKLEDAMKILGYQEKRGSRAKGRGANRDGTPGAREDSRTSNRDASANRDATVRERAHSEPGEDNTNDDFEQGGPTLGPDYLTDDQVEAVQIYENNVLNLPPAEQYHRYFIVQTERKQVGLTHDGVTIAQEALDLGSLYAGSNMEWPHLIENALRAQKVYERDKDYVVQNGEVIIVDPFTGRLMIGRQWSDGLHQAVEAKERVRVKEETQTLATITIQNFIKLYSLKAGMTGTAMTEANEFGKIYRLDVVEIPTNRPINRVDHNDKMYRDVEQKYGAIVEEIHEVHRRGRPADPFLIADILTALRPILEKQGQDTNGIDEAIRRFNEAQEGDTKVIRFMLDAYDEAMGDLAHGRPVLVGTTSVENSEKLSRLLERRYGIDHEVLNAKNHSREADIVAKAGHCSLPARGHDKTPLGNVTIATNMAGRGTDIKLGEGVVYKTCKVPQGLPDGAEHSPLYPPGITKCCIHCDEYDPATNCAHCFKPKADPRFPALGRNVCTINVPCGLHIIGTERHEARRIDNQLRGRSGRQGDPGSSRFSLSLEDDLLKMFMPDWMLKMMERLGFSEGTSLEDKRLTKGIERAQRKVEERNFSTRKHLLEWDEPMDFQRKEFYTARQRILEERDLPSLIFGTINNAIQTTLQQHLSGNFNRTCIAEWCRTNLDLTIDEDSIDVDDLQSAKESIRRKAKDESFEQIRTSIGEYIDSDEPPNKWDVSGLLRWAQRSYKVSMTQNQMRKMDPSEIEDALIEAAETHCEEVNLDGIALYLDSNYPFASLAEWGRTKFNVKLDAEEMIEQPPDEIARILDQRVHEAYREREISYPAESCLELAFAEVGTDHAAAAESVAHWANRKYGLGWSVTDVQSRSPAEIRDTLVETGRAFYNGRLEQEVETAIVSCGLRTDDRAGPVDSDDSRVRSRQSSLDKLVTWGKQRFGIAWNQDRFDKFDGGLKEALVAQGREMLRWELTRLEQYVLLRIYDGAWKDHLLEMDHLKAGIMQRPLGGDQTHPQSQFAIEGRDLFTQMWARIAARVTEIIFKVRGVAGGDEGGGPTRVALRHADSTGTGFAGAARDQEAAMRAQNTDGKVETIRRETPRVGRNQPCPCGSGKKFKQCHGKT